MSTFGQVVAGQDRNANAQIHIHPVLKLLSSTLHNTLTSRIQFPSRGFFATLLSHRDAFDAFLILGALENAMHVNARKMNLIRVEVAGLEKLLHLGNADLSSSGCWVGGWLVGV